MHLARELITTLHHVRSSNHDEPAVRPGTAPRTNIRLFSASMRTSFWLRTVVLTLPNWPGIRLPFITRLGNALAPVPPNARWHFFTPCVARWPENLCRLMAPAKPRPLQIAVTSTDFTPSSAPTLDLAADRQIADRAANLADESLRLAVGFGKKLDARGRTLLRPLAVEFGDLTPIAATGQAARLVGKAQLNRLISIALDGADLQHVARAGLDDRHRDHLPRLRRISASSRPCGRVFRWPSLHLRVKLPDGRQGQMPRLPARRPIMYSNHRCYVVPLSDAGC